MTSSNASSVALLYPGDRSARDRADPMESRFVALFAAFSAAGVHAEPAVYHDDFADEVAAQWRQVAVVLVWYNPIEGGRRRDRLDALLRDMAGAGMFVSTHPDAILRLGTKDVLVETRDPRARERAAVVNSAGAAGLFWLFRIAMKAQP